MYHVFIHSSVIGRLGSFRILTVAINATMKIGGHISFQMSGFVFFGKIPRSRIAGSYGVSIFNFLRALHVVFYSGFTNVLLHQQCVRIPFSPHPHQHLLLVVFLIIAVLTGVQ